MFFLLTGTTQPNFKIRSGTIMWIRRKNILKIGLPKRSIVKKKVGRSFVTLRGKNKTNMNRKARPEEKIEAVEIQKLFFFFIFYNGRISGHVLNRLTQWDETLTDNFKIVWYRYEKSGIFGILDGRMCTSAERIISRLM